MNFTADEIERLRQHINQRRQELEDELRGRSRNSNTYGQYWNDQFISSAEYFRTQWAFNIHARARRYGQSYKNGQSYKTGFDPYQTEQQPNEIRITHIPERFGETRTRKIARLAETTVGPDIETINYEPA